MLRGKAAKGLAKQLRNVGPKWAEKLVEAGIDSPANLRQLGDTMAENDTTICNRLASDVEDTVDKACGQLARIPRQKIEARLNPSAWSVKEIIGHLIDSASNNLQRFVRLQVSESLVFPDYSQDNNAWVSIQRYQEAPWDDLLSFWRLFNHQLSRVIRTTNQNCIAHEWILDENTSITLGDLMIDYLRHLRDHLQQIEDLIDTTWSS